ncbi:MAG: hypothetical protein NVS2B16_02960 [Chloroflexota bacterium]
MSQHNLYPFITVVVPTRNRADLLDRLLASLSRVRYPRYEVIVVDDESTDRTAAIVNAYQEAGLPVIYLHQRWGRMGAARNRAIERAGGEIIAFTDDDCVVSPLWLYWITVSFAKYPRALGVQGKTETDHASITPFTRQVEQLHGGQPYRTCNIAYRTGVLRELGGFDAALIRGEDVVMGMRILERGEIVFAPEAVVTHPPRPKEWADRRAWRLLLESELHFRRTYRQYAAHRSPTLSLGRADHAVSRWILLPIRRYWRWHFTYFKDNPRDYLRHVPLIIREKAALIGLLPLFWWRWRHAHDGRPR